jgi:antitoxin CptB
MSELDRLRWHCRRGMLELDMVLADFVDSRYSHLDAAQAAAFRELLDCPNFELWDYFLGRAEPETDDQRTIVKMLQIP